MWNPQKMELMPGFWPPKPNGFWRVALAPLRRFYLRKYYGISRVDLQSAWPSAIGPNDGVLIAPNHSHDSDPHVMMNVGRQLSRQMYFMAAWQVFKMHGGIDGWVMQRFGAFSVDREGCDRRAIRQAMDLLTAGQVRAVFPGGEVYRTNEPRPPPRGRGALEGITAPRGLENQQE